MEDKNTMMNATQNYDLELLVKQIESHLGRYYFSKLESYDGNFLKNLSTLLKNVPKYIYNKNRLKVAKSDYSIYYRGEDLKYFIRYIDKSNSIKLALDIIFKTSDLTKEEIEYLFNQKKCVNWISEYCNLKTYDVGQAKKLVKTKN